MKIAIASDHDGYEMKEHLKQYLTGKGHWIIDCGTNSLTPCDYTDFGAQAATMVTAGLVERGIVICDTGIGISIITNKVQGIRCALCVDILSAELSRKHNDANMLAMGAATIDTNTAEQIADVFLTTAFEGGSRRRQLDKIKALEKGKTIPIQDNTVDPETGYDAMLPNAVDVVLEAGQASVAMLQRRLRLDFGRTARLVGQMEEIGVVGPYEDSKPRQLKVTKDEWNKMKNRLGFA